MAMLCSWTIGHAERGSWEGDDGLMESTCTACETDAATLDVDGCGWMCFGIDHELVSVYVTVCGVAPIVVCMCGCLSHTSHSSELCTTAIGPSGRGRADQTYLGT